jgi:hypothetical protein
MKEANRAGMVQYLFFVLFFVLEDSTLEVDQLGNQDWCWSSGISVESKVAPFISIIPCIAIGK